MINKITIKMMKNTRLPEGPRELVRCSATVLPDPLYSPRIAFSIESIPTLSPPS
jgi:hypothetical protein